MSTDAAFQRIMKDLMPDSPVMIVTNEKIAGMMLMASSEGHTEFKNLLQRIDQQTEQRNLAEP